MSKRKKLILSELEKYGSVNVLDLVAMTNASESTIRRDLMELDEEGLLKRVHGGAVLLPKETSTKEDPLSERELIQLEEKKRIGAYAAGLIEDGDVVYLDAGSTTLRILDFLEKKDVLYVTNGLMQAQQLSIKGYSVICLGGEVRGITGACVGARAITELSRYHFTKGFFGTNGVDVTYGFTTIDSEEAAIKEAAMARCQMKYVLCDHTKFHKVCPIHFGEIKEAIIISDQTETELETHATIVEVKEA